MNNVGHWAQGSRRQRGSPAYAFQAAVAEEANSVQSRSGSPYHTCSGLDPLDEDVKQERANVEKKRFMLKE